VPDPPPAGKVLSSGPQAQAARPGWSNPGVELQQQQQQKVNRSISYQISSKESEQSGQQYKLGTSSYTC
jgi:hypothetical protein